MKKVTTPMPSLLEITKNKGAGYIALEIRKRSSEINQGILGRNSEGRS